VATFVAPMCTNQAGQMSGHERELHSIWPVNFWAQFRLLFVLVPPARQSAARYSLTAV